MYKGFRLDSDTAINKDLVSAASTSSTTDMDAVEEMIMSGQPIDAAKVADCLFPQGKPDVFLSHSFQDRAVALDLAAALRSNGLSVFIDSEVWSSVYDLLRKVDDEYCWQAKSETYAYSKRNQSTAHVYMILNTALHKMIDRAEAFFFIGSENSLVASAKEMTNNQDEQKTCSPWIHSELMISSMIRRNRPERHTQKKPQATMEAMDESMQLEVHHSAPVEHLQLIPQGTLEKWLMTSVLDNQHPLDRLYEIMIKG